MKQAVCILVVAAFVLLITGAGRTTNQTASPQPTTCAAGATYVNSSIESGNGSSTSTPNSTLVLHRAYSLQLRRYHPLNEPAHPQHPGATCKRT
jgi:hypothetical protein